MSRWRTLLFRALAAVLIALCAVLGSRSIAGAQVALDTFRPQPSVSDGFALARPQLLAPRTFNLQAIADYANDPLVLRLGREDRQLSVVHNHLVVHVGGAVGLSTRVMLFASLPIHAHMDGTDPGRYGPRADGPGIGDLALGGRVLLAGTASGRGMLSAELVLRAPTAELVNSGQAYSGDKIGSYEPALLGELSFGRFAIRMRVGARFRQQRRLGDLELGQELVYGLGARLRLFDGLYAHAELNGASYMNDMTRRELTPLELLLGAKSQLFDWNLGAAAGPGLVRGYGTPDARVIVALAYAPVTKPTPIPKDSDGDGLVDATDGCPQRAEDRDNFEDEDGCPDLDDDRDGIEDARDGCSKEPEDKDGYKDADGCPELDNDNDTIVDTRDKCPLQAEAQGPFSDADGCPDLDRDGDTVLDRDDQCPLERGAPNDRGCPAVRVDTETSQLTVPSGIEFASNKADILSPSEVVLDQLRQALDDNPQLERIRIEGHTDDVGRAAKNLDLSKRRAGSVAGWLIAHGIARERLEAWGCGTRRPVAANDNDEHRQQNRRVEFHILASPRAPAATPESCIQMTLK